MTLSKEEILKRRPREHHVVEVPELGGSIRLRALTTSERSRFEASLQTKGKSDPKKTVRVRERLIALSVVGEDGELLFSDDDHDAIAEQPAKAMERIFNKIQEINGFSSTDVEELEKNSEPTTGG